MQTVEGADPHLGTVTSGKVGAELEGILRHGHVAPESGSAIILEITLYFLCINRRNPSAEDLLSDSMRPLRQVKRRQQNGWSGMQQLIGCWRMYVLDVNRK